MEDFVLIKKIQIDEFILSNMYTMWRQKLRKGWRINAKGGKEWRWRKWGIHNIFPSSKSLRGNLARCNLSFIKTQRVFWLCFIFHPPPLPLSPPPIPFLSFYPSIFPTVFSNIISHKATRTIQKHSLIKFPLEPNPRPFSMAQRKNNSTIFYDWTRLGLRWGRFG